MRRVQEDVRQLVVDPERDEVVCVPIDAVRQQGQRAHPHFRRRGQAAIHLEERAVQGI